MTETQGPTVNAVAIAFACLTAVTISLRLWARIFVVKSIGPDDFLICVAVLLSWSFIGATVVSVKYGLGSHIDYVEQHLGEMDLLTYAKIVWLSSIFYNACLGFIKTSVLALYMRLGDRKLRRLAMIMTGVVACQAGGNVLACIFQCSPISAAWDKSGNYRCIAINSFYIANAAVNIFTDILTYCLPIPLVVRLKVPTEQKISLAVILCLGLFACVSSIIRITYIPQMLVSTDATWAISGAMYWSVIETNIGILAASIPSYKVLAKRYVPRLLGSSSGGCDTREGSGFKMKPWAASKKGGASMSDRLAFEAQGGKKNNHFATHIDHGLGKSNSSEEALCTPDGRIGVKTEIKTHYEEPSA